VLVEPDRSLAFYALRMKWNYDFMLPTADESQLLKCTAVLMTHDRMRRFDKIYIDCVNQICRMDTSLDSRFQIVEKSVRGGIFNDEAACIKYRPWFNTQRYRWLLRVTVAILLSS
jgi:hypothetical protein